jgi:hypothetical protein
MMSCYCPACKGEQEKAYERAEPLFLFIPRITVFFDDMLIVSVEESSKRFRAPGGGPMYLTRFVPCRTLKNFLEPNGDVTPY